MFLNYLLQTFAFCQNYNLFQQKAKFNWVYHERTNEGYTGLILAKVALFC